MRDSEALDELRTADGRRVRVTPFDQTADVTMPDEFEPRRLVRRTLQIVALLAVWVSCGCSPRASARSATS